MASMLRAHVKLPVLVYYSWAGMNSKAQERRATPADGQIVE
jgi:hypothetical protein